jgi:hypothetical protein
MARQEVLSAAGRQYAAAYEAHYTTKDLREALQLYRGTMVEYPDSAEAGYSRAQIQNIAKATVPGKDLCDAEWELALSHVTDRQ